MIAFDYSLVVGVDAYHLRQLALVWPTWKKHKPSLLAQPMIIFFDRQQTKDASIRAVVDHPDLRIVPWPLKGLEWDREKGEEKNKFRDPHRAMMLSGFVYVPALFSDTPYWLKLDTDVVATGTDDCPGYCLRVDELGRCPARCECAYVREIIHVIRNRHERPES